MPVDEKQNKISVAALISLKKSATTCQPQHGREKESESTDKPLRNIKGLKSRDVFSLLVQWSVD